MSHQEAFDFSPRAQQANLERVSARIGREIVLFLKARLKLATVRPDGAEFRADELRTFVEAGVGKVAPGSADRILRALRQQGVIAYEVVSRSASLYRVTGVK